MGTLSELYGPLMSFAVGGTIGLTLVGCTRIYRSTTPEAREARRRRRAFSEVVTYPIGKLGDRMHGRIAGRARPEQGTLLAPITGRPCIYYEVEVLDQYPVIEERMGVPFLLDDGSGRALVYLDGARLALAEKTGTLGFHMTVTQRELFARHGQTQRTLRFRERIIPVGGWLEIIGAGTREPDPQATPNSYRGDLPTRIVLSSAPERLLLVSDGT